MEIAKFLISHFFIAFFWYKYLPLLKGLNFSPEADPQPRKRSNSLPVPKIEVTSHECKDKTGAKDTLPNIDEDRSEALSNISEGER